VAETAPATLLDLEIARLRKRLLIALGLLVLVMAVGVVGFLIVGGGKYSLIDAAYMTVITITTVGYGEIVDMSQNPAGRVFTMLFLMTGMGVAAYSVSALTAFVIEGQLNHLFTRRRMQKVIAALKDHFIVCGDTPESWHVAEELIRTRRPMVFVGPTEAALDPVRQRDPNLPVLSGDPGHDAVLQGAGIERAAGVVFAMENEKDNVIGVLTARRLAPNARIIATSHTPETEAKLGTVGADAVVTPEHIGGLRLASVLVRPAVVTFLDTMLRQKGGTLRVEEIVVPERAAGRTIESLDIDDVPSAVLLALRGAGGGDFAFKPAKDTSLSAGAVLVVMADADGVARVRGRLGA